MGHWLAPSRAARTSGYVKRFGTVDFPRPMMASVVTIAADALRVEAVFYRTDDLAGLIWEAEDRWDHPLLRYETARDFRKCRLSFRWRSFGLRRLDEIHGPTLTVEGRDEGGSPRTWYVRLWNYAQGTPEDAQVTLDFGAVAGGWAADDPAWAGDVDRMFVSLVAPEYDALPGMLASPAEGWVELSGIACEGSGSMLAIGDAVIPEHRLRIATGYDDHYHLSPARLLRNALQLGYRRAINHYVGMSHYFRLDSNLLATLSGGALNGPCTAWHRDFLGRAGALGYQPILSLSYELLAQHCPESWKQRAENGDPALTGWDPPSALLSPCNGEAMSYLQAIGRGFAALAVEAGLPVRFQIGEPWWWVMPDRCICLYDAAAVAAFAPASITDVTAPMDAAQLATLDAAGAALADSTAALCSAVRQEDSAAERLLPRLSSDGSRSCGAGSEARERADRLGGAGLRRAPARGLRLGDAGAAGNDGARDRRGDRTARLSDRRTALSGGLRAAAGTPCAMDPDRAGGAGGVRTRNRRSIRLGSAASASRRFRALRRGRRRNGGVRRCALSDRDRARGERGARLLDRDRHDGERRRAAQRGLVRRAAPVRCGAGAMRRGGPSRAHRFFPRSPGCRRRLPLRGSVRPQLERDDRLEISVRQVGTFATSRAAELSVPQP